MSQENQPALAQGPRRRQPDEGEADAVLERVDDAAGLASERGVELSGGSASRCASEPFQMRGGQLLLVVLRFARTAWTGRAAKSRIGAVRQRFENLRPIHVSHPNTPTGAPRHEEECRTAIYNAASANTSTKPSFERATNRLGRRTSPTTRPIGNCSRRASPSRPPPRR